MIAADHGTSTAEVALAWVCAKKAICSPIISAASVNQLESNVQALDLELSLEEIESLDRLYRPRDVVNDYVPVPMKRHSGGIQPCQAGQEG
jgi:aryl-alcohol dehydrogenase-like predicted oxidoreductase